MAALEFKFSSDQQHQLEAIEATCDLFRGQQFIGSVFSADSGRKGQTAIGELMVGHGNELRVAPGQLLDNLHAVQEEGCLPATDVLTDGRLRDFTVEMETGTGKTYVYIRSIYELNRRYGITKFVIVVPSVAIREGVLKSLQTTRRHFETLYDRTPLDYFVYDSKDMGPVGNFATSSSIQVMVINIDAFNKGLEKDGTAKEGNLFHRPSEKLTGGFSPRELVSACKPVVIIDEPQSVDNTKQAKAAIIERQTGRKVSGKTIAREERLARRIAEDLSPEWAAEVDSGKLIEHAIEAVDGMLAVRPPQVTSERASLGIDDAGVSAEGTGTSVVSVSGKVKYDLPDPIAELQDAVGLTRGTIKAILEGCSRLDEFEIDPATFLAQVGDKINRVKNDLIAQGIKYVRLPEDEWYTMRDLELDDYTAYLGQNAWKPDMTSKSLYNYVVYDSAGVERSFAEALDKQEEVLVFAKLPSAFKIDTPLGSYNPDWAYVEEADGERRVYFVTETKGGKNGEPALRDAEKIKIGCAKKHFEALDLGNDFHYNVRTTYQYEAVKA